MRQLFKFLKPEKIIKCQSCGAKFRFPVKPGKVLNVTCPKCRSTYKVSFVNPIVELIKGRLKWSEMGRHEKRTLAVAILTLLVSLGLILGSLNRPIKPNISTNQVIENVN